MYQAKVFIISAVTEQFEAVNSILRHLAARGNDVTLFDMTLVDPPSEVLKDIAEHSDATVLITEEYSANLTQVIQSKFKMNTKLKRSSNVWNHNGLCCTILGGSVKKTKVAKELWEVLQESDELDLTDLFPFGSRCYPLDYSLETAQPMVL